METYYATPVEMAENLCINPLTIYAWVFSGKLRAKQEGNDNLIENNDFINFISSLSDKEKRQADIFQDLYCHLSKLYSGIDGAAENNRASYINKINAEALKIMKK